MDSDEPKYMIPLPVLMVGVATLTSLLHKHYGKPCVVLLDEYDVPLHYAFLYQYDEKLLPVIRRMMGLTFQDNPHLAYGLLMGCLSIAVDSMFPDSHNLEVCSVQSIQMDEYF